MCYRSVFAFASILFAGAKYTGCDAFAIGSCPLYTIPRRDVSLAISRSSSVEQESNAQKTSGPSTSPSSSTTNNIQQLSAQQVKEQLLELVPSMTGQPEELRQVEEFVNTLEALYQPAQTLPFLNFAMQGDWQLLFSTNFIARSMSPRTFRLRELYQRAECNGLEGVLTTEATWDLARNSDAIFDASGTFSVTSPYKINQGARMVIDAPDHVLRLAPGSSVPAVAEKLVGYLMRSMPKELFDPSEHGVDPTYLDADLKIVRYTGPRLEGVRDIFIRRGTLVVDPTRPEQ